MSLGAKSNVQTQSKVKVELKSLDGNVIKPSIQQAVIDLTDTHPSAGVSQSFPKSSKELQVTDSQPSPTCEDFVSFSLDEGAFLQVLLLTYILKLHSLGV